MEGCAERGVVLGNRVLIIVREKRLVTGSSTRLDCYRLKAGATLPIDRGISIPYYYRCQGLDIHNMLRGGGGISYGRIRCGSAN